MLFKVPGIWELKAPGTWELRNLGTSKLRNSLSGVPSAVAYIRKHLDDGSNDGVFMFNVQENRAFKGVIIAPPSGDW